MSGCLHNDISIGNTGILKIDEATALSFAYPRCFEDVLNALDERHKNRYGEDAKLWEDLQKAKDELETLLKDEYSIATSQMAYVTDIDLGIPTNLLWDDPGKNKWERPSVSHASVYLAHSLILSKGTKQFMSLPLIQSMKTGSKDYQQSPADDLESFFYVTLIALFCNKHTSKNLSRMEKLYKSLLLSGDGTRRGVGLKEYLDAPVNYLSSPPVLEAQPIMDAWHGRMYKVFRDLRMRVDIDQVLLAKDAAVGALWRRSVGWVLSALLGVLEILRIIHRHEEVLKEYKPFVR